MQLWALLKRGFMTFWYWHVRQLNLLWPSITVEGKQLVVFPSVYKPLEHEHASVAYCNPGDRVLDLGCGSGVNSVFVSPVAREILAVDINPAAIDNAREN